MFKRKHEKCTVPKHDPQTQNRIRKEASTNTKRFLDDFCSTNDNNWQLASRASWQIRNRSFWLLGFLGGVFLSYQLMRGSSWAPVRPKKAIINAMLLLLKGFVAVSCHVVIKGSYQSLESISCWSDINISNSDTYLRIANASTRGRFHQSCLQASYVFLVYKQLLCWATESCGCCSDHVCQQLFSSGVHFAGCLASYILLKTPQPMLVKAWLMLKSSFLCHFDVACGIAIASLPLGS